MSDSEIEEVYNNPTKVNIGKSNDTVKISKKKNEYAHSDNESLNQEDLGLDLLANPNQLKNGIVSEKVNKQILINSDDEDEDESLFNQNKSVSKKIEKPIPLPGLYDNEEDEYDDDHIDLDNYKEPERNFDEDAYEDEVKSQLTGNDRDEYEMSQADVTKEKRNLLFKLFRYKKKGVKLSENFTMNSSLESLRTELHSIKKEINLDQSVKVAKNMLISTVSIIELLNNKYDPFDVYLKGWSEEVNENVDDYDEVFEELYDKYEDTIEVSPEIKFLMMLGGSAVKYHIAHTVMKSFMPNNQADSFLRNNPDIKNQIGNMVSDRMQKQTGIPMGSQPPMGNRPMPKQNANIPPMRPQNPQSSINKPKNIDSLMKQLEQNTKKNRSLNINI